MLLANEVKDLMIAVSDEVIGNEEILSEADRQMGDGDHGLGMKRGFIEVKKQLEGLATNSIREVFTTVGMALMGSMGGASGPIFGMLFHSGGMAIKDASHFDGDTLCAFLDGAVQGVVNIGKAKTGEKTMLDALVAAKVAASNNKEKPISETLAGVADGARQGMENTKNMIAKQGRARILGKRSIGYLDPGAISVYIIFKAASDYVAGS